jgi:hypothetical protein
LIKAETLPNQVSPFLKLGLYAQIPKIPKNAGGAFKESYCQKACSQDSQA